MSYVVVPVPREAPEDVLARLGAVADEFPGSDVMVLTVGERRLTLGQRVRDGTEFRAALLNAMAGW